MLILEYWLLNIVIYGVMNDGTWLMIAATEFCPASKWVADENHDSIFFANSLFSKLDEQNNSVIVHFKANKGLVIKVSSWFR